MPWGRGQEWGVAPAAEGVRSFRNSSGENRVDLIALGERKASDRAVGGHEGSEKTGRPAGR